MSTKRLKARFFLNEISEFSSNFDIELCAITCTDYNAIKIDWSEGLPQYLCYECYARVSCHAVFRDKCLRSENLLADILQRQGQITEESIKSIDRIYHDLTSRLTISRTRVLDSSADAKVKDVDDVKEESDDDVKEVDDVKEESDDDVKDVKESDDDVKSEDVSVKDERGWRMEFSDDDVPLLEIKNENKSKPVKKRLTKPRRVKSAGTEPTKGKCKKRGAFDEAFATEILLTKEQQLLELNQRAMTLNYMNSPYKCEKCYKGFVEHNAYTNHLTKHDASSGEHVCEICQMCYTSVRRLRAHAISSHARKYACKTCDNVSHTANQAREHDKWHKGHVYKCKLCSETFRKPTSHLTHMRKRHPTEFVCNVCGDSFVGRHGLMMHKKKTHKISHVDSKEEEDAPKALERYCRDCDLEFSSVEAWKRHTVTSAKHALNNDFGNGCRICGDWFESRALLTAHSERHARRTREEARPKPHFDITHLQCDQCSGKFVNRSKLLAHIRRVHLGMKYNKNIVCELCGKSCTSNATLKYHQRTHTGEKPYSCSECPKRFSDRNQLRIHNRTHTDERPYSCLLCQKTFRQKPALNRHLRVHTGAKPYECQHCGKTFSQSNSLKIHVHTVHLKLPPMYRNRNKQTPQITITQEKPLEITLQRL